MKNMKRISICLILVLIAGISCVPVSCGSNSVPPVRYNLTISSTAGGTVTTPSEGTFPYSAGTVVNLVALADECYEFVNWTGDAVANPNSTTTTITMDATKTVTANFALMSYSLTVDSTDGGSVTDPGEGIFTYDCGTVVELVAIPDTGYRFVKWTGDIGTIADINAAETTVTMNDAYAITANFIAQYGLTIASTDGGEVITPGEGTFTYDAGTVVNLVAKAEESYSFVEWTGNISTIASADAAETTITMNGNYSITAKFIMFAGGNGTTENPYKIADWRQLDNVRNYLSSHFTLINDIDSSSVGYMELASATANEGKGWQSIGNAVVKFTGSFNGQEYEICDLFINRPNESNIGLFGIVGNSTVENVGVVNGNVTGKDSVGILVGKNEGAISNTYSNGSVNGNYYIGGLTGKNEGTINSSYSSGNVIGNARVGGLIGQNSAIVDNSYATGSVTGSNYVGGLVGKNEGTISNSYSNGSVTGTSNVGGLVGKNEGAVSDSFWDTQTSGQATSSGGTGKTTAEMQDVDTFLGAAWDICAVAPGETNSAYTWNIVDGETYPFLGWE